MAESTTGAKLDALRKGPEPRIAGKLISDEDDALVIQAGGCVIEVPRRAIVKRNDKASEGVELVLEREAEVVVSLLVSAKQGFVTDNVFGALSPSLVGENCNCNCSGGNCNCNCSGGGGEKVALESGAGQIALEGFRRPFTGGARR